MEGTVAALWSIDEFFDDWLKRADKEPFLYDNHLRPQSDIVPEGAAIFRLEEGLAPLVAHLDSLAGKPEGPREIPKENVRKKGMGPDAERLTPSPERSPGSPTTTPRISGASAIPPTTLRVPKHSPPPPRA